MRSNSVHCLLIGIFKLCLPPGDVWYSVLLLYLSSPRRLVSNLMCCNTQHCNCSFLSFLKKWEEEKMKWEQGRERRDPSQHFSTSRYPLVSLFTVLQQGDQWQGYFPYTAGVKMRTNSQTFHLVQNKTLTEHTRILLCYLLSSREIESENQG